MAEDLLADDSLTAEQRFSRFEQRARALLPMEHSRGGWGNLESRKREDRYGVLEKLARADGNQDWDCPGVAQIVNFERQFPSFSPDAE